MCTTRSQKTVLVLKKAKQDIDTGNLQGAQNLLNAAKETLPTVGTIKYDGIPISTIHRKLQLELEQAS